VSDIETLFAELPHGITLHCRVAGPRGAPALMFLHGFPEAAFVWDEMLGKFGTRYRCIAPNLRGFEQSSAPADVQAYRMKHLMADLMALIDRQVGQPLEALVAHDWGGAVAWSLAAQHPEVMRRLVIINSPHPATFLRELQTSPTQQATSAYMNDLCAPDAESRLSENDFKRMWAFLAKQGSTDADWLTAAVKDQYRAVWRSGLTGALNYYRASPLRPPTGPDSPVMGLSFPLEFVAVHVPTHVIWAEDDIALLPALLDGLERFVPRMTLTRVPGASHWILHERPEWVAREIQVALGPG
jgi:pimeloyl-ACP methyl ester carboxylesterase